MFKNSFASDSYFGLDQKTTCDLKLEGLNTTVPGSGKEEIPNNSFFLNTNIDLSSRAQLAFPDPEVSRVTKANGVSLERPARRANEGWRA